MFLNNFYTLLAIQAVRGEITAKIKKTNGVMMEFTNGNAGADIFPFTSSGNDFPYVGRIVTSELDTDNVISSGTSVRLQYNGVIFGNGNTPPTVDDYYLSGEQVTNLSYTYNIVKEFTEDNEIRLNCLYTITNNNAQTISISEIGLVKIHYITNGYYPIMLERTVLDTPVVIEPSGVGQVRYVITFKLPS